MLRLQSLFPIGAQVVYVFHVLFPRVGNMKHSEHFKKNFIFQCIIGDGMKQKIKHNLRLMLNMAIFSRDP